MRITEQELAERKKRLIYAAYELFCEQGIESVSLSQISKKSAISLGAIYHYYESKTELIQHTQKILWYELADQLLSESYKQRSLVTTGLEEMSILLRNFQKLHEQHSAYLVFACEYRLYMVRNNITLSLKDYTELIAPVYKAFVNALERGRSDKSISSKQTAEDQFFSMWGIFWGYVEQMVLMDKIYGMDNPFHSRFSFVIDSAIESLKK